MFFSKNRKIKRTLAFVFSFVMAALLIIPSGGFGATTTVYAESESGQVNNQSEVQQFFGASGLSKDSVYAYNFSDGSVVPTTYDSANRLNGAVTSADGNLKITSTGQLYTHDKQHGLAVYNGDVFEVKVAGNAVVTFNLCQYGGESTATIDASSTQGVISSDTQLLKGADSDGLSVSSFTYTGDATTITFTMKTLTGAEMYLHGMNVSNLPESQSTPAQVGNGKTDVWDFGAAQLDTSMYNNMLTESIINSWYPSSVAAGSTGNSIGSFGTDEFMFVAQGYTNNRIRTSNTNITRYDAKTDITVDDATLTGYIYSNNANNPTNSLNVKSYKNDMITVYAGSNGGQSTIWFVSPTGKVQKAVAGGNGTKLSFYASEYGLYKMFSADEKLVVYRVERTHTQPVIVSGTVDTSLAAGLASENYKINFTNKETGEVTQASVTSGHYSVYLNEQYNYDVTLENANGYIITSMNKLSIAKGAGNTNFPISIKGVELVSVTGEITGLSAEALGKLQLSFENKDNIYVPDIQISGTTYTAKLEKGVTYKIQADNINDYQLSDITVMKETADTTQNIAFALKPTHKVTMKLENLPESAISGAKVTFININETGYSYSFSATDTIGLRDGQYEVVVSNIGEVPYVQSLTSNLKVSGADISKSIQFERNTSWDFSLLNGNPGVETINGSAYYSGLQLSGAVLENKSYLLTNADGEIKIPVKKGDIVNMSYCYCAAFSVNGVAAVDAKSGSTTQIDTYQYAASDDGYATVKGIVGENANQTYFTSITVMQQIPYSEKVYVGADKEYKTINNALDAVSRMARPNNERVEIVIDPGNYEEMLTINIPNVTLKNAAGSASSIEVVNNGVDVAADAVRITSYYGHGYNYYSMNASCKYDAKTMEVNKENGYLTTINPGSGTTNGSYWNATVVVNESGFEADGIIFENSYNQYISKKESEDTVVEWATGGKGTRSTTYGDTSVQDKSFVERAAAIAINGDQSVFNGCKFIGRQDTLYGGAAIKSLFQKCDILGATDYIFGGFTAVFYQCNLTMNTNDTSTADVAYITAAQQSTGRGYLMYNCNITSTTPGLDTASKYRSKPGYFGRPWAANTSEVVYYKTVVGTTDYPDAAGQSLISQIGWNESLGGQSTKMYEYASMEKSGVNNTGARAAWATQLSKPELNDGTAISIEAFLGEWATALQAKGLASELSDAQFATTETVTGTSEERQLVFNSLALALDTAQALSSKGYTAESFAKLTDVINRAKAVSNKDAVGVIQSMTKELQDSVAALVTAPESKPETPTTPTTPETPTTPTGEKPGQATESSGNNQANAATVENNSTETEISQTEQSSAASADSVSTGDHSFILFYELLLAVTFITGVLVVVGIKRKKEHN